MSIIDNLIIVHHPASKKSFLFDIHLVGEVVEVLTRHRPFLEALPVEPFKLPTAVPVKTNAADAMETVCDLYSQSCVIFPPDVVLDAKLGCFWYVVIICFFQYFLKKSFFVSLYCFVVSVFS